MHLLLDVLALVTAVFAGVRSSWSPCGRSMLSTLTPLAVRGRGQSYRVTAAWFVAGSVLGGACTGVVLGALAAPTRSLSPSASAAGAAVAASLVFVSDAQLGGFVLPFHRRQVNERWLDRFRPWVYGAGFGWQIGTGFATYIRTAGLYLMAVLAVLSGDPMAAIGAGLAFGTVRGLAVLGGRSITDPAGLVTFHRRFDAFESPVRLTMIGWEAVSALAAFAAWSAFTAPPAIAVLVAGLAALVAARGARRRHRAADPVDVTRADEPRAARLADVAENRWTWKRQPVRTSSRSQSP